MAGAFGIGSLAALGAFSGIAAAPAAAVTGPVVWPVNPLPSPVGLQVYGSHRDSYPGGHRGSDFGKQNGRDYIVSIAAGHVTAVGHTGGFGNHIYIQHDGFESLYAHMLAGSPFKSVGQAVYAGELIGRIGNTGDSIGAHLHLEIKVAGTRVDPYAWLQSNVGGTPVLPPPPIEEDDQMKWFLRDDGNQSIVGTYTFVDYGDANRAAIIGTLMCNQTAPIPISMHQYNILYEQFNVRVAEYRALFPGPV